MEVLIPYISCFVNLTVPHEGDPIQEAIDQGYAQIYIQTQNGVLKQHMLRPGRGGAPRYIRSSVDSVPNRVLPKVEGELRFLPDGKIPYELLDEVKKFFRAVIKTKGTAVEAMIWILWSEAKGYYLHVPNQVVSHASAQYDWASLPSDSSLIVDIHSHADFAAFFSGTDNNDDNNSIKFSGVIGHNTSPTVSTKWRFNYLGHRVDIEPDAIFEHKKPEVEEVVPNEWLEAVQIRSYTGQTGKTRMDGTISSLAGTGSKGTPTVTGTPSRHPFYPSREELEELADNIPPKSKGGSASKAEKKPSGGQGTPSVGERAKGNSSLISVNGVTYERTGNGLRQLSPNEARAAQEASRVSALQRTFENTTGLESNEVGNDPFVVARTSARIEHIKEEAEDQSESAAKKQAQFDMSQDPTELIPGLLGDMSVGGPDDGFAQWMAANSMDIPPDFDEIACNHGMDVARAYTAIDIASTSLVTSQTVLTRTVENLFNLIDDEKKLAMFRTLAQLLPTNAQLALAHDGL